jgi:hypothetical protein
MAFKQVIDAHHNDNWTLDEIDRDLQERARFKSISRMDFGVSYGQQVHGVHRDFLGGLASNTCLAPYTAMDAIEHLNCRIAVPGMGVAFVYPDVSTVRRNVLSLWPQRLSVSVLSFDNSPVHALVNMPPLRDLAGLSEVSAVEALVQGIAAQVDRLQPPESGDDDGEEKCSVCHRRRKAGDFLVKLACEHRFHCGCMHEWNAACRARGQAVTCPLCRAQL